MFLAVYNFEDFLSFVYVVSLKPALNRMYQCTGWARWLTFYYTDYSELCLLTMATVHVLTLLLSAFLLFFALARPFCLSTNNITSLMCSQD